MPRKAESFSSLFRMFLNDVHLKRERPERKVDVIVTTAGGIEEDLIKCLSPLYIGDFSMSGKDLYDRGLNRNGNTLIPVKSYYKLDQWMMPILKQMQVEQDTQGVSWTPSKMIHRLGKEIDNPESVYYWAYKNNIPVFSPALTDGAIGDLLFLFGNDKPGLKLDIAEDVGKSFQVFGDSTIIFPLLVAETFADHAKVTTVKTK